MLAITTRVAVLTSSELLLVLDLSLLLGGGNSPWMEVWFPSSFLWVRSLLVLGGWSFFSGGDDLPGMSLGIGLGVAGWQSRHQANSTAIIFVRKVIIIIFLILRLTVWDVELPAVLVPWAWLP